MLRKGLKDKAATIRAKASVSTRSPPHTRLDLIGGSEPDLGNAVLTFISNTKKEKINTNVNTFSIPNAIQILIGYT